MFSVEYQPGWWGELVGSSASSRYWTRFEIDFDDDAYDSYSIRVLALKTGNLVYNPNYIVITKDTPQTASVTEKQFQNALKQQFAKLDIKNHKVGESPYTKILSDIAGKKFTEDPSKINIGETEQEDVLPLPKGISTFVGGRDFTVVAGPYPDSIDYMVGSVVRMFENAAQPFIQNNLAKYYNIRSEKFGDKTVRSKKGQEDYTRLVENENVSVGYYKYVIDAVLKNNPRLQSQMRSVINNHYPKIPAQNTTRIDLQTSPIIAHVLDDSSTLVKQINNAMLTLDSEKLSTYERMLATLESAKIDTQKIDGLLSYFSNETSFELLVDDQMEMLSILYPQILDPVIQKALSEAGYTRHVAQYLQTIRKFAEDTVEKVLQGDPKGMHAFRNLLPYLDQLNLSSEYKPVIAKIKEQLQIAQQKQKEQEAAQEKIRQQEYRKRRLRIAFNEALVDLENNTGFVSLGRTEGLGTYLYNKRDSLDYKWFDNDRFDQELYDDAYNKAYEQMGARPSDSYGEDLDDIENDIEYYADDFLEDIGYFDTDEGQGLANAKLDALATHIKNNEQLRNEFVDWRKEMLRSEEGDWEPDNTTILEYADDIGPDMLEQLAFRNGIMHVINDVDPQYKKQEIVFYVHSDYLQQAKSAIQEISQINSPSQIRNDANSEEEYEFHGVPASIWLVDKEQSIDLGRIGNIRIAHGWYVRVIRANKPYI